MNSLRVSIIAALVAASTVQAQDLPDNASTSSLSGGDGLETLGMKTQRRALWHRGAFERRRIGRASCRERVLACV